MSDQAAIPAKKNTRLSIVPLSSSYRRKQLLDEAALEIKMTLIDTIRDLESSENCPHFMLFITNLVENVDRIQLTDQEKDDMILKLVSTLFPRRASQEEVSRTKDFISFIRDTGLVQRVAASRVVQKSVSSLLKKTLHI